MPTTISPVYTDFPAPANVAVRADVVITDTQITVRAVWSGDGLDRTDGLAWGLADRTWKTYSAALWDHRVKLAHRLARAINSGAVFGAPTMRRDVRGKTYINADSRVYGKRMNADLACLGF